MKNKDVRNVYIQISGVGKNKDGGFINIGLLNFGNSLKGKLRRSLQDINDQLTIQDKKIQEELEKLSKSEDSEKEIEEYLNEEFVLNAWNAIPITWIDEIETSALINHKYLIEQGVLFDDTKLNL